MFLSTRGDIEERCLSAIGVADKCHIDCMASPFEIRAMLAPRVCILRNLFLLYGRISAMHIGFRGPDMWRREYFARLLDRHNFYHGRLAPAQRYFIVHQPVFNRVVERGRENCRYFAAFHKAHLHYALPERSVAKHFQYNGRLAALKIRQSHCRKIRFSYKTSRLRRRQSPRT